MAVITISSSFGSGGSVVAQRVAGKLGWDLHNRAIPIEVAARMSVPLEAAIANDEASQSRIGRVLAKFSVQFASESSATSLPPEAFLQDDAFKVNSESVIRALVATSNCVIVGRAAAIVIGKIPTALHVRLDGSPDLRVIKGAEALNISNEDSARRRLETDRARSLYVRHFYGADWTNPALYDLTLDSTAISLEACTKLVLASAADRFHREVDAE
jgi:cytidylate kinase